MFETAGLSGYTNERKAVFFSTDAAYHVVLKNVNYNPNDSGIHDTIQDNIFKTFVGFRAIEDDFAREAQQQKSKI